MAKFPREALQPEAYRFPLGTSLLAGPAALGTTAYFPGRDGYVYAFDTAKVRVLWRQIVGNSPVTRTPVVAGQDLFVVSAPKGCPASTATPVSRSGVSPWETGYKVPRPRPPCSWRPARSSSTPSTAAADFLILDRARGLVLSRYDVRDFVVPVVNEQTDRVYLAANNGLLLCLRDRDYPLPQCSRTLSDREAAAGKTPDERARDLRERLTQPVNFEASEAQPLTRYLDDLRRNYGIKWFISEKSFRENNLASPVDQKVKVTKRDKMPLGNAIQEVLAQINCKYAQLGDEIFIIPSKAVPKP